MLKGISFDVWGTLFTEEFLREISRRYADLARISPNDVEAHMAAAYSELRTLRREGAIPDGVNQVDVSLGLLAKRGIDVEVFRRAMAQALEYVDLSKLVQPGVRELIPALHKDYRLVVLGNVVYWPGSYTRVLMEKAGLSGWFLAQLYSDEIGAAKPSRLAFKAALEHLGVGQPREALHVGDIGAGLHGALISGGSVTQEFSGNLIVGEIGALSSAIRLLSRRPKSQAPPLPLLSLTLRIHISHLLWRAASGSDLR